MDQAANSKKFPQLKKNDKKNASLATILKKEDKMNELFHPAARLFCVHAAPSTGEEEDVKKSKGPIVAFTLFRFEWDDEEEPEYPVLYCYELQIRSTFQGRGLGRKLMDVLKVTATKDDFASRSCPRASGSRPSGVVALDDVERVHYRKAEKHLAIVVKGDATPRF